MLMCPRRRIRSVSDYVPGLMWKVLIVLHLGGGVVLLLAPLGVYSRPMCGSNFRWCLGTTPRSTSYTVTKD
jgi:hypothetical protein